MAIIYTYPIVTPTSNDLVLGTDVDAQGKPTKNFTIQSIIDLVTVSGNDLQAVLNNGNTATQNIVLTGNISATNFTDGTITISGGDGAGFTNFQSTNFAGNLTGVVKAGSSIESAVTGVTQNQGDDSTKLATTAYVDNQVDPSVLQYLGDATGPFNLNLVTDDFKITGTANQIQTTATAVAGNVGTINLKFPTTGVTLPDGSTATTQLSADDSTDVATTAFVQQENNVQDLDFIGDTGTSSVLLNSQTLDFEGTTNQITTAVTAQKVKFSLPSNVTIGGVFTGVTFAGDLNGTVNTLTTGVTQTANNNSTKIATTAYVDAAAGAKTLDYAGDSTGPFSLNLSTDDLEFNGDSNITVTAATVAGNKGIVTIDLNNAVTISGKMQAGTLSDGTFSGTAGTYTGGVKITSVDFETNGGNFIGNASTATALAASGAIALSGDTTSTGGPHTYTSGGAVTIPTTIANTTVTGKTLLNLPTPSSSAITASDTILAAMAKLQGQITGIPQGLVYKGTWNATTNTPTLASSTGVTGEFYIVSVAGNTNLNGITDWQIGDWAIFVEVGATDTWQKIDNSQSITGSGATNKITKWTAPTVLGTGLIEDDGTDVTIGNSGNLIVEGNTTLGNADTDSTTVKGPARFEETLRVDVGIGLGGATYGTAGQVLTSGGGAASVNTWTTPTVGTVTSVGLTETGNALTITGSPVTSSGTINIAGAGSASQYINGALDLVTFPTVDNYVSWTADSDQGTDITVTSGFNLKFTGAVTAGGAGIATDSAVSANEMTIGLINAGGTPGATTFYRGDGQWSVPVGTKTETLAEVLTNGNTTGGTDIAVGANDDITFTDTSKALFGASFDLQVYHDGSDSYVRDTGTGQLYIDTQSSIRMISDGSFSNGKMATFDKDGPVELYYNNLKRFGTTSAGVTFSNLSNTSAASSSVDEVKIGTFGAGRPAIYFGSSNTTYTNSTWFIENIGAAGKLRIGRNGLDVVEIFNNGNTTFAGSITAGDGNFTGNVEIDGNLTVDGSIIHGSGGGTFNGNKAITSGASALAFTLTRAVTGTLVFDVWLTSGTSNLSSVAKKYTVAHSFNSTPVYNKIIDTGPNNTNDFTVTFANSNTGANGTSVTCSIISNVIAANNIGYTVQVGHESVRALTFTAG